MLFIAVLRHTGQEKNVEMHPDFSGQLSHIEVLDVKMLMLTYCCISVGMVLQRDAQFGAGAGGNFAVFKSRFKTHTMNSHFCSGFLKYIRVATDSGPNLKLQDTPF